MGSGRQVGGSVSNLRALARAYGIETFYTSTEGRRRAASPDAIAAVARALGAPLHDLDDIPDVLRYRHQARWSVLAPPVAVAWDGRLSGIDLRASSFAASAAVTCHLVFEDGDARGWLQPWDALPLVEKATIEGLRFERRYLSVPQPLPSGYHHLHVELARSEAEVLIIAAPRRAFSPPDLERCWGIFAPAYALHSNASWGVGDLTNVASLVEWVANLGGSVAVTTPLLAAFLANPCEPSPYSPVSRLFWNELYVDPRKVPESHRDEVRDFLSTDEVGEELAVLRAGPLVDYPRAMALKRRALEATADRFFAASSERQAAFEEFRTSHPAVGDYARFRAAVESSQRTWPSWPERLRSGHLDNGDIVLSASRYHQYVQWLADQQIGDLSRKARELGVSILFDYPLGCHPDGYDAWRNQDLFARDVAVGAPPDLAFPTGQNWGFHALLPERAQARGHDYFIRCLRHQLAYARLLRIDHVMGLHRMYWVPEGFGPSDGVYVRYPWDELYAILSLESHRHRALIVGEDLGTVPPRVRAAMARHGLQRTYVLELDLLESQPLERIPSAALASLNTHDHLPFAAFWRDVSSDPSMAGPRVLLERLRRDGLTGTSQPSERDVFGASLELLAQSRARAVVVNLEDLWQETEPQNVPGTSGGANWRRKLRRSVEELSECDEVVQHVTRTRRGQGRARVDPPSVTVDPVRPVRIVAVEGSEDEST
ncbi:MAG: 4-alpha-glucanotransferase [Chloroflexi bacterium]|nr:4-alpha-glucanotransferase [Chloroflexota bacterium]